MTPQGNRQPYDSDSSVDYRALMSCTADDGWLLTLKSQLGDWLREKNVDVELSADVRVEHKGLHFRLDHHRGSRGSSVRAQLIESSPLGEWKTELIGHEARGSGTDFVSLVVTNDQRRFVDVPRLARYLMQSLPLGDASVDFVDRPQVYGAHDVAGLIDLLCDPDRHGLVFVAGSDTNPIPFDTFNRRVATWTREVYGLAQVIVLDPTATVALEKTFGQDHGAKPWAIRTYFPGVDPASRVDARRHRILGTGSLAELDDKRIEKLLGRVARTQANTRVDSPAAIRVTRDFRRLENSSLIARLAPESPPPPPVSQARSVLPGTNLLPMSAATPRPREQVVSDEAAAYLAQIELTKAILGVSTLDEAHLTAISHAAGREQVDPIALNAAAERIDNLQSEIERLEDTLREATKALDETQLDLAVERESLDRALAAEKWLRRKLTSAGKYETAYSQPDGGESRGYPESLAALVDKLAAMPDHPIVFTGDRAKVEEVDQSDGLQQAVQTCWNACLALADYVRARAEGHCEGGVDHYLRYTPEGYESFEPGKHAKRETSATMQQFGDSRIFPVPDDVDQSGRVTMEAHFRLARIGMTSPRMYYHDDVLKSGRIYIGYIGRHLPNTKTN